MPVEGSSRRGHSSRLCTTMAVERRRRLAPDPLKLPPLVASCDRSWRSPGSAASRGSGALANLAAADTARTYQHPLDAAADQRAYFLQVGIPAPLGLVIGVADAVAHRGPFAEYPNLSHRAHSDPSSFWAAAMRGV